MPPLCLFCFKVHHGSENEYQQSVSSGSGSRYATAVSVTKNGFAFVAKQAARCFFKHKDQTMSDTYDEFPMWGTIENIHAGQDDEKHKDQKTMSKKEIRFWIQIPRLDAVSLLYKLKHSLTLLEILEATDNPVVRKAITDTLTDNLVACHDGVNFHCQIKD